MQRKLRASSLGYALLVSIMAGAVISAGATMSDKIMAMINGVSLDGTQQVAEAPPPFTNYPDFTDVDGDGIPEDANGNEMPANWETGADSEGNLVIALLVDGTGQALHDEAGNDRSLDFSINPYDAALEFSPDFDGSASAGVGATQGIDSGYNPNLHSSKYSLAGGNPFFFGGSINSDMTGVTW